MRKSKNGILVIENVPEYEESLVRKELGKEWNLESARFDPRCLGLPTSRARVFMICWRVKEFLSCLTSPVVMNVGDYFFMQLPKQILSPSAAP